MGAALGAAVIVLHRGAQRLALGLGREGDDGGGAAAGRRAGSGVEVVGHARGGFHRLVEVAVRVDAAGCDDAAGGIDLAGAAFQAGAELRDPAAADADVAVEGVAGSGDAGVADDQVKGHGHTFAAPLWC